MDAFKKTAAAEAIYSGPIQTGDSLVISATEVVAATGFNLGAGHGLKRQAAWQRGRTFSRNVAVIVASSQGVRVEPVIDLPKVGLAALIVGAVMLGTFLRLLNPTEILEQLSRGKWD